MANKNHVDFSLENNDILNIGNMSGTDVDFDMGTGNLTTTGNIRIASDSSVLDLGATTGDYTIGWNGDAVHTISAGDFAFMGGNFGIGTAEPEKKLHVSGGDILLDNNQFLRGKLSPIAGGGFATGMMNIGTDDSINIWQAGAGFNFKSNIGADLIRVLNNGNFGIGTTDPRERLEILDESVLASESLTDGNFSSFTEWTEAGDFAEGINNYVYTHGGGTGTLTQITADLDIAGVGNRWYKLQYTVSNVTETGILAATLTTAFAATTLALDVDGNATKTHYFLSKASPGNFVISATSNTGGDTFTLDDVTLKEVTGGNLIVNGGAIFGDNVAVHGRLRLLSDTGGYADISTVGTGSIYFQPANGLTYFNGPGQNNRFFAYDYREDSTTYLSLSAHVLLLTTSAVTKVSIRDSGDSYFNGGNVGINTTSPDTKLQVVGDTKLGDDNTNYVEIGTTGDVLFVGGAGFEYGGISVQDNGTVTSVSSATFTQFVFFSANSPDNGGVTSDQVNEQIIVTKAGDYKVTCCFVVENNAGAGHIVEVEIQANNGTKTFVNLHQHRTLASGTDKGAISICGIVTLAVDDTIELWVSSSSGSSKNITISDASMSLVMIGG